MLPQYSPSRRGAVKFLAGVVLPLLVIAGCSLNPPARKPEIEAEAGILAAVLSDKNLQSFFHQDTRPERFPLQIVDAAKTGVPAILIGSAEALDPAAAQLIVESFARHGTAAEIAFRFPLEGLVGKATLTSDSSGAWTVEQMHLVER